MNDDQLTPHFRLSEFRCTCCGNVNRENAEILANALEPVREDIGPIVIVSSFRCPAQNARVGGRQFSMHLVGLAADIFCDGDSDRFILVESLLKHGFRRIGIDGQFIHADKGPAPTDVLWLYR